MHLYRSANYPPPPNDEVDAFVAAQPYGIVLAQTPAGHPGASLLPFVMEGNEIEVHMVQQDPTFQALLREPKASFLVQEFLAFTPHWTIDPEDGAKATLHFRAVLFAVTARCQTQPAQVAAALERLLRRYEADAPHRPFADRSYGARLQRLAVVRMQIESRDVKFKTAQHLNDADRLSLTGHLRERRGWRDAHAAKVIAAAARRTTLAEEV